MFGRLLFLLPYDAEPIFILGEKKTTAGVMALRVSPSVGRACVGVAAARCSFYIVAGKAGRQATG